MSKDGLKNRRKLEHSFILSLIIIIVVITLAYMNNLKEVVREHNQVHIKEVTVQTSNNISDKLNNTFAKLEYINENIIYKDELSIDDKLKLVKLNNFQGEFEEILLVNNEGIGIDINKDMHNNSISISETDFFKSIKVSNEEMVSKPFKNSDFDRDAVLYSVPIIKNNEKNGFIIGVNKADVLMKQLSTNIYEDKGRSFIVDKNSKILFSNKDEYIGKELDSEINYYDASKKINDYEKIIKEVEQGATAYKEKGERIFLGFSKIPYTEEWYVVNFVPENVIYQTANNSKEQILILIIGIILVFIVIGSYLLKNHRELKTVAFIDKLTKISNKEKFILDVKEYIGKRKNKKCVIICFDVNKFKIINDIYGYKAGDEVLKTISDNLKRYFDSIGVYGRLKDDIFGLVLECRGRKKELESLINIIKYKVANIEDNGLINSQFNIDVSIGIYLIENKKISIDKIISNANIARQKSKESMINEAITFDEKLSEEKQRMIQLEKDLFSAIENNELCVYYQPKFNIHTGVIVGSEALIRWKHSNMGTISPMIFIPIAENNKFINKIGKWVFEQVCKTLREFIDYGIDVVPVAVNISRVELYQPDLIDSFEMNLKKYNIPPELIEIEITETTALNNITFIKSRLSEIKALGIRVAMDDFGTGNSNFSNLKDVPIDILKIDRSLLKDIEKNTKSEMMVSSIVSLSNNLNLNIICEGVENTKQIEVLKKTSCEVVQGYVFSKPLEEHKYEALLRLNNQKIG